MVKEIEKEEEKGRRKILELDYFEKNNVFVFIIVIIIRIIKRV